ncbi:MAG: oligosaccharide flippase family protein [bacterium]|nr:oligosaccharide flippase family protein [bacterium]
MPDKDSGRKAVRAGVGYTIGNLLIKGLAFLSIPIFSNLLSTADYGVFNTYSAYMSLFTVVISLGLPSSIRTAHYDFGERSKEYISCGALLIVMNLALFLALGALCRQALELYGGLKRSLVFLAVLSSFGSALLSYYNSHLSMEYKSREFLAISFFYSFSSIALSILLICTHRGEAGYYWRALGNTLPMLLVAAYVLFRLWRRERPRVRREYARYGLRFGLPLIPHDLSRIVLSQFDRIMIAQSVGDAQAGLFSFACNLGLPIEVLTTSIDTAWCPWLFERLREGDYARIRRRAFDIAMLMSVGASALMLISPELIRLLSAPGYWESRYVAVPIVLSMYFAFLYILPAGVEYYLKKTQYIAAGTMAVALLNVLLNALCIPRFGYVAAAYTTVVSYALYYLFHTLLSRRLFGRWVVESGGLFALIGCVAAVSLLAQVCVDAWMIRWGAALALGGGCLAVLIRRREQWKPVLRGLLGKQ